MTQSPAKKSFFNRNVDLMMETELDLYSSKNPNTTTAAMQAVILDLGSR